MLCLRARSVARFRFPRSQAKGVRHGPVDEGDPVEDKQENPVRVPLGAKSGDFSNRCEHVAEAVGVVGAAHAELKAQIAQDLLLHGPIVAEPAGSEPARHDDVGRALLQGLDHVAQVQFEGQAGTLGRIAGPEPDGFLVGPRRHGDVDPQVSEHILEPDVQMAHVGDGEMHVPRCLLLLG